MAEDVRTRLVETGCNGCVIRLLWSFGDEDPRFNYIDVQMISNHGQWWQSRWRNRLMNAWAVLRGRYDWSGFQLGSPGEARELHAALSKALAQTWPGETEGG